MSFNKNYANEIYESLVVKKETVVRMYVQSFDNETIAEVTTLPLNQVKEQILHIKSGELIKSFDVATKMIAKGMIVELVSDITGLQKDVVEELKKDMIEKGEI